MYTLIVYVHLIAACVAVGILLMQDLALAKTGGRPLSPVAAQELERAAHIIFLALAALWASGLAMVTIGYLNNPQYFANQKILAKIAVVVVLTINGILLHHYSFPRVVSSRGIVGLGFFEKTLVVLSGSVSTVSWLFACYLGIARPWNNTVEFNYVLFIYLSLLFPACVVGCAYVHSLAVPTSVKRRMSAESLVGHSARDSGLKKT